ncbi:MAG: protein BatD [Lentisphaerae bacterium]|nr:protein BatD [Lentisphaerota bacterium]
MNDSRPYNSSRWQVLLIALALLSSWAATAQPVSVHAAVEGQEFFLGESFTFQVQVQGDNRPQLPDTSVIRDFTVKKLGGRNNSSKSVSMVNGRVTRKETRGYIFNYKLTPKRIGRLTIPPIQVVAGGKRRATRPVPIVVREAEKVSDSKLHMTVSRPSCFVGEPITLTLTWFFAQDINNVEFAVPALDLPQFDLVLEEPQIDRKKRYHRLQVGTHQLIAEQGRAQLGGKTHATLKFSVILIPTATGTFPLPKSTVVAKVLVGYRDARRSSRQSMFNDFFGSTRQAVHKKIVVPSNAVTITVKDVPAAGRPAGFAGHIGKYAISARAAPTDVSVGDPITLTVSIGGPDYLDRVELPPLHLQAELTKNFKIPEERATGKIEGKMKVFTQTVRALHADVVEIPALELPYFDTTKSTYATARSKAIPITVKGTRVVTADDAEGTGAVAPAGRALKAWGSGILHNYDELNVLRDQRHGPATWLQSPKWIALLGAPPACYFALLFGVLWFRRRHSDPLAARARQAAREFRRSTKPISLAFAEDEAGGHAALLEALRAYFGSKLGTAAGAITFRDVAARLEESGVNGDVLQRLQTLFEQCEASTFAGGAGQHIPAEELLTQSRALVDELEGALR